MTQERTTKQEGWTRREIALQLGVTVRTLDRYIERERIRLIPTNVKGRYLYEKTEQVKEDTHTQKQDIVLSREDNNDTTVQDKDDDSTTGETAFTMESVLRLFDPDFDFVENWIAALEKRLEILEQSRGKNDL